MVVHAGDVAQDESDDEQVAENVPIERVSCRPLFTFTSEQNKAPVLIPLD